MQVFLTYLASFISASFIAGLIEVIISLPMVRLMIYKPIAPLMSFITSFISHIVAMGLFIYVIMKFGIEPTAFMFFVPYFALIYYNKKRIKKAKIIHDYTDNEEEKNNAKVLIKMEQMHLWGDTIGVWVPLFAYSYIYTLPIKWY